MGSVFGLFSRKLAFLIGFLTLISLTLTPAAAKPEAQGRGGASDSKTSTKSTEKRGSSRDSSKELKERLAQAQKTLQLLQKDLEDLPLQSSKASPSGDRNLSDEAIDAPGGEAKEEEAPKETIVAQIFIDIPGHLKKKVEEFYGGLQQSRYFSLIFTFIKHTLIAHFLSLSIILVISLMMVWGVHLFARPYLLKIFKKLYKKNMPYGKKVSIFTTVLLSYILPFYILYFVLKHADYPAFYNIPLVSFNLGFLYIWIKCVLHPKNPSAALFPCQRSRAFSIRSWILCINFTLLSAFIVLNIPIQELHRTFITISDIVACFVTFGIFKATKAVYEEIESKQLPAKTIQQSFKQLISLRVLSVLELILWIGLRQAFYWVLSGTIMVLGLTWLYPGIQWFARYIRLSFLWKHRQEQSLSSLLARQKVTEKLFIALSYLFIFSFSVKVWQAGNTWNAHSNELFFSWLKAKLGSRYSAFFDGLTVFLIAYLLDRFGTRWFIQYVEKRYLESARDNDFFASRLKTLLSIGKTSLHIFIWVPSSLAIIGFFYNITPFLTSIGFATFGFTFGIQTIVKDFITGFFIILENNLMVGDMVDIDGKKGIVETINLRTVKLRTDNGMLLIIPFGHVSIIGNRSRSFSRIIVNIAVCLDEPFEKVRDALEQAFATLKRDPQVGAYVIGNLEVRGINEVSSYSATFQGRFKTAPGKQEIVRRSFNAILKQTFQERSIAIPSFPSQSLIQEDQKYIFML